MTWLEHHKASEQYAQLAEAAHHQQDDRLAQTLYAQAAQSERLALSEIDSSKPKTLGIIVVSAVALSLKANEHRQAEQIAYKWLGTDALPPFAIPELRQLLLDIWEMQPSEPAIAS